MNSFTKKISFCYSNGEKGIKVNFDRNGNIIQEPVVLPELPNIFDENLDSSYGGIK
ncbi:MAG: hypothetical protein IJN13_02655 [Bacilli bacterium]|nr:hypothetical protein [Bacilli bacterium]